MPYDLERPWTADFPSTATKEDILACFRLLLGRYPSETEWPGHSSLAGTPLHTLVAAYLNSLEFRHRALTNSTAQVELVDLKKFRMYVGDDPVIGGAIRDTAVYEPEVAQIFTERLHPGAHVLDVGANIGYFSLLASSLVGPTGRVFAFEPLAANVKILTANRIVNQFSQLEIIAGAASDRVQTVSIGASYSDGIVGDVPPSIDAALGCDFVVAMPIDSVVDANIDLLKIDVEGHEYRAISGATKTIRRSHPVIISEFSPDALEANSRVPAVQYLDLLRSLGYSISPVGQPTRTTNEEILELTHGVHHIDILAERV